MIITTLPYGDQAAAGQLEKHVLKPLLAILTDLYGDQALEAVFSHGNACF